jgi:hypothetical protein
MSRNEQLDRALHQALACREDPKRAQATVETLRRKEIEAIQHLQALVSESDKGGSP